MKNQRKKKKKKKKEVSRWSETSLNRLPLRLGTAGVTFQGKCTGVSLAPYQNGNRGWEFVKGQPVSVAGKLGDQDASVGCEAGRSD